VEIERESENKSEKRGRGGEASKKQEKKEQHCEISKRGKISND
jgi:hypothetical protein